jgi:hypothetical protein
MVKRCKKDDAEVYMEVSCQANNAFGNRQNDEKDTIFERTEIPLILYGEHEKYK